MFFVLSTIAPVFAIVFLGAFLRRTRFLPDGFFSGLNKLAYWVGLPALLFVKVAQAHVPGREALSMFLVLSAATLLISGLAFALCILFRVPRPSWGALNQAAFRGNLAFVGWAIISYALESLAPARADEMFAHAVLAATPLIVLYNVLAVMVLVPFAAGHSGMHVPRSLKLRLLHGIGTNPLVIACLLALPLPLLGWKIPAVLSRTLEAVGGLGLPCALLGIGASIQVARVAGHMRQAIPAAVLKLAIGPLLGYLLARAAGLDHLAILVVTVYMGCPTAVASYVLADQLKSDGPLAGSSIVVSTAMSLFSLGVILFLFAPA